MAEVEQTVDIKDGGRKRKPGKTKAKLIQKKKQRIMAQSAAKPKAKVDKRMKKLYQKRARDYNSDNEEEDKEEEEKEQRKRDAASLARFNKYKKRKERYESGFSDDEEGDDSEDIDVEEASEDEDGGVQPGITKFNEGIRAFKMAFRKIVKKSADDDDVLGPVLSAHKKLLAEKLAEEEVEKKVKGEVKKEKHLKKEKGHVKPANYLDAHEKFLLGVATKGVVKLFNAVNKAQNAQKGLNPLRSKDEKVIKKRRKEAFFSELGRTPSQSAGTSVKVGGTMDGEAPGWAPLRDNYMLTNPKLKDWDKMQDTNVAEDFGRGRGRGSDADSSSDDE